MKIKTNPLSQDTDEDGNSDFFEYNFLLAIATEADQGKDSLNDGLESGPNFKYNTLFLKYDTNGDDVPDGYEVRLVTDQLDPTDNIKVSKLFEGGEQQRNKLQLLPIPPASTGVNPPLVRPPMTGRDKIGN